jgi:pyruvate dehydrogenase E2 component (dihydrolipoamide acetyltransferase)
MAVEVILPRVDMDMVDAKISKWHVKDGDAVKAGAALFEIETDKAAMEIEAPASGIVRNITVAEGNSAPVGSAVAYIYGEGEAITAPPPKAAAPPARPAAAATVAIPADLTETPRAAAGGIRATPLARRLARQLGLELSDVTGSGPHGRIVADDVQMRAEARGSAIPPPAGPPPEDAARHYVPGSFESLPVDGMRRTIAQRLTLSKQTVPHFYLSVTCNIDRLLEARAALNEAAPRGADKTPHWRLSVNDFVIKALGLALQRVPAANVTWAGDRILQHRASDVGVAVAVEGGLFTPVLRAVESRPLSALSQEMKDLAAKARARKLVPAEY